MRTGNDKKLSDLVDEEVAQKIALKHMPNEFVWENKGGDHVMQWVIDAMREYRYEGI